MAAPAAMASASTSRWKCSPSPQIAVCHFGLFRDLTHTLPSLRANVHAALERQLGGVDVFVHALLVSRLVNARSGEDATLKGRGWGGALVACNTAHNGMCRAGIGCSSLFTSTDCLWYFASIPAPR